MAGPAMLASAGIGHRRLEVGKPSLRDVVGIPGSEPLRSWRVEAMAGLRPGRFRLACCGSPQSQLDRSLSRSDIPEDVPRFRSSGRLHGGCPSLYCSIISPALRRLRSRAAMARQVLLTGAGSRTRFRPFAICFSKQLVIVMRSSAGTRAGRSTWRSAARVMAAVAVLLIESREAHASLLSHGRKTSWRPSRHLHPVRRPCRPDSAVLDGPHPSGANRSQA
jgi:hypothetical protein